MKTYALRKTSKGYMLTEIELQQDFYGNTRKYSHDFHGCIYKKQKFAEEKAKSFFGYAWNGGLNYIGMIDSNQYVGEIV